MTCISVHGQIIRGDYYNDTTKPRRIRRVPVASDRASGVGQIQFYQHRLLCVLRQNQTARNNGNIYCRDYQTGELVGYCKNSTRFDNNVYRQSGLLGALVPYIPACYKPVTNVSHEAEFGRKTKKLAYCNIFL